MVAPSIAARMEDYFRRQLDLLERMARADTSLSQDSDAEAWGRAQRLQAQFSRELSALEEEFGILKREWDTTDGIEQDARDRMREFAHAALEMGEKIARANAQNAATVTEMMSAAQQQWAALQRGKRMLRNLRAGEPGDAGFIDRKA